MDMHVYADRGEVESDCDGEVRRLSSDPRQLAQLLDRVRQHPRELLPQHLRKRLQVTRLVVVEPHGEDQLLYRLLGKSLEVLRREARALRLREEPPHRARRAGVLRARGEDRPHEHAERIVRLRLYQLYYWRAVRLELALKRPVHRRYVLDCHAADYSIIRQNPRRQGAIAKRAALVRARGR